MPQRRAPLLGLRTLVIGLLIPMVLMWLPNDGTTPLIAPDSHSEPLAVDSVSDYAKPPEDLPSDKLVTIPNDALKGNQTDEKETVSILVDSQEDPNYDFDKSFYNGAVIADRNISIWRHVSTAFNYNTMVDFFSEDSQTTDPIIRAVILFCLVILTIIAFCCGIQYLLGVLALNKMEQEERKAQDMRSSENRVPPQSEIRLQPGPVTTANSGGYNQLPSSTPQQT